MESWLHSGVVHFSLPDDPALSSRITRAFFLIATTDIGMELLKTLEVLASSHKETLKVVTTTDHLGVVPQNRNNASNGVGTPSTLFCNLTAAEATRENLTEVQHDSCILFHELIHVYHNWIGERIQVIASSDGSRRARGELYEEARTVGLGRFRDEYISENIYREQLKVERRTSYAHQQARIEDDDTVKILFSERHLFP